MSAEQVYPYRAKPGRLVWGILFFGALGLFMLHEASGNTRGLIINGIIRLSPGEATIFYYVVAAIGLAFVPLSLFALYIALTRKTVVVLGPSAITAPGGIRKQERTITYGDIKSIQHRMVHRQEFVTITPRTGKTISIAATLLPSKDAFTQVRTELTARAKAAQRI
jgi:hypothetical protein